MAFLQGHHRPHQAAIRTEKYQYVNPDISNTNCVYRILDKDKDKIFNTIDEVIEKHIKPMNAMVQDVISNKKFLPGNCSFTQPLWNRSKRECAWTWEGTPAPFITSLGARPSTRSSLYWSISTRRRSPLRSPSECAVEVCSSMRTCSKVCAS